MNKFLFRLRKYGPQPPPKPVTLLDRLRRSALPYSGAAFRFQGQKIPSARDRQRQRRTSRCCKNPFRKLSRVGPSGNQRYRTLHL